MRPVRNPTRMKGNRTALNPPPRSEITADIKKHFVCFHVVMNPRDLHRFGVSVEQARSKRADNITANLEGLMDGRRLMHRPGNRLEILSIKGERVDVTIPSDDIERMMRIRDTRPTRTILNQNLDIFVLVDGEKFGRPMQIALGIRR